MKLLALGGRFAGQYLDYEVKYGSVLRIPWTKRLAVYSLPEIAADMFYNIAYYRLAKLGKYTFLIDNQVEYRDEQDWILRTLLEGYKQHKHCDDIYEETGNDCRRSD